MRLLVSTLHHMGVCVPGKQVVVSPKTAASLGLDTCTCASTAQCPKARVRLIAGGRGGGGGGGRCLRVDVLGCRVA